MRVRTIIVIIVVEFLIFQTGARAMDEPSGYYKATCVEKDYDCDTDLRFAIDVTCSFITEESKNYSIKIPMVIAYRCKVKEVNGVEMMECKTHLGGTSTKVLTKEEFTDTQSRCTKICFPCPTGWK